MAHIYYGEKVIGQLRDGKGKYSKVGVIRRFVRKMVKLTVIAILIVVGAYSALQVGAKFYPHTVYAVQEKVVEVVKEAPILAKIAKCESGDNHYDKNGQVLLRGNTNKTVDVGRFQINSVWFAKATELGLDLTNEDDNKKFAQWLYENRGTEDWKYSKACWSK